MQQVANIVRLRVKNFLGISDVEIRPGHINQIVGANNQGKTSILRAIEVAVKGSTDGQVVKHGEDAAEILLELPDETTIRRRIRKDGKQSVTVARGEFEVKGPQAYLDTLFDEHAFNPLDLLDPKARNEAIMEALPISVTKDFIAARIGYDPDLLPPLDWGKHGLKVIDDLHRYLYQRRAEANKSAAEKAQRFEVKNAELPPVPADPELSPEECRSRIEQLKHDRQQLQRKADDIASDARRKAIMGEEVARRAQTIESLAKEDATLDAAREREEAAVRQEMEQRLSAIRANFDTRRGLIKGRLEENQQIKADLEQEIADIPDRSAEPVQQKKSAIDVEIQRLEGVAKETQAVSAVKAQHKTVMELGMEADAAKAFADALTAKVNLLAGDVKKEILSTVEMPIEGLTYADGEFLLDGVRVENLSSSRAIKLAVAIARKHARRVKVICIDGAEALDHETWAAFAKEIENDGFTYFITKVGEPFVHGHIDGADFIRMQEGQVLQ